jgi:hypothetical protein
MNDSFSSPYSSIEAENDDILGICRFIVFNDVVGVEVGEYNSYDNAFVEANDLHIYYSSLERNFN